MYEVVFLDSDEKATFKYKTTVDWEKLKCRVVGIFFTAEQGKLFLKNHTPDIIMIDIDLKDGNGMDVLFEVKKTLPNLEITIITLNKEFLAAKSAINLGVTAFLSKPARIKDIQLAIKKMVSNLEKRKNAGGNSEILGELKDSNNIFVLNKALNYIEKNYNKKLTLKQVAEKTFVSSGHLSKLINKYLKMGFNDVLNETRVEKAKKYLKNPEYTAYQIAEKVGIADETYFSKIFKKYAGVTPNQYRNIFDKIE